MVLWKHFPSYSEAVHQVTEGSPREGKNKPCIIFRKLTFGHHILGRQRKPLVTEGLSECVMLSGHSHIKSPGASD